MKRSLIAPGTGRLHETLSLRRGRAGMSALGPAILPEAARLFNGKFYFECHDYLEDAWGDAKGTEKVFLQGLIHVAVGMYHVAAANHEGAVHLLSRGLDSLAPFAPATQGLDVESLLERVTLCLDKSRRLALGEDVSWESGDVPLMEMAALD